MTKISDWFDITAGVRQGCVVAPVLVLKQIYWIMERTTHRGYDGLTLGKEVLQIWTLLMTLLSCLRCLKSSFLLLKYYKKSFRTWAWKLIGPKPGSRPVLTAVSVLRNEVDIVDPLCILVLVLTRV